ncbi:hypothetical protein GGR51DRAFT_558380 [Nemania sp. FL0031]|nr:hypothetical protein GGR51DRAFT_558380 [Nemania sp. FL0031]
MSVRTASCLCGGVKVEMRGEPLMKNLCHCSSCQKFTGGPFGSLAAYKTEVRSILSTVPASAPYPPASLFLASGLPIRDAYDYATSPRWPVSLATDRLYDRSSTNQRQQQQVAFTESEPSTLKTYEDTSPESGGVLKRSFCGKCGSPVRVQRANLPGTLVIPIGIIDGDKSAFKPQMEFYCKGKADWVGAIEDTKTFETQPTTYPAARE